jgi:hypothetical protein
MIRENLQSLIAQLEAGHSDALTAYLNAMSRFHRYSFLNCLEIARQRPTASRVAGMYVWNQLGRRVNEGEKGIRILQMRYSDPARRAAPPRHGRHEEQRHQVVGLVCVTTGSRTANRFNTRVIFLGESSCKKEIVHPMCCVERHPRRTRESYVTSRRHKFPAEK